MATPTVRPLTAKARAAQASYLQAFTCRLCPQATNELLLAQASQAVVSAVVFIQAAPMALTDVCPAAGACRVCAGTFIAGMLARNYRKRVHTLCLIDPVCFGMFMPHLLHNFLYRVPSKKGNKLSE